MNQIERGWKVYDRWVIEEILKYKARFVHLCYKVILPPDLYVLAKEHKEMDRCSQWAKDNGWKFAAKGHSLLLLKDGKVLGEFRPVLEGGQLDPHLEFYAMIAGERVELVEPDDQRN